VSFVWPLALLGLLIVPLALFAYLAVQRRRPQYAARFTNLDLLANVVDKTPGWRRHVPSALYLLALVGLLTALARPQMTLATPKEEATVLLVMDVSGSMNAEDVEPTRMAAAQLAGKTLVEALPEGFRIGLITFSTGTRTLVEPTTDRELVNNALDSLVPNGGTAMGDAIVHAVESARLLQNDGVLSSTSSVTPSSTPDRRNERAAGDEAEDEPVIIILLSDGFNTAGSTDPLDATESAIEAGLPIFTIALGTPDGVALVTDSQGRQRTVRVPPDEETLAEIAELTEARFFSAPTAEELQSVYEDLGSKIGYDEEQREITVGFVAAAAALVVAAGGLSLLWFNRFP